MQNSLVPVQFQGGSTVVPLEWLEACVNAFNYWAINYDTDYPVPGLVMSINLALSTPPYKNKYYLGGYIQIPAEMVYQIINGFSVWDVQSTVPPIYYPAYSTARSIRDSFTSGFTNPSVPVLYT